MNITYRQMTRADLGQAIGFWQSALDISEEEARLTFWNFSASEDCFRRTYIAADETGKILSTVCYWLREVTGAGDKAEPIGHVFHVATAPSAQKQGHATQLLKHVSSAMLAEGCQLSVLSARQNAVSLYQKLGWDTVQRHYWRGTCAVAPSIDGQGYLVKAVHPKNDPTLWTRMAGVYEIARTQQLGSLIRTEQYWQGYGGWMFGLYLDHYEAELLTVWDYTARTLLGYALVNYYEVGFAVSEMIVPPQHMAAGRTLVAGILNRAAQLGKPLSGQFSLPATDWARQMLVHDLDDTLHQVNDTQVHGYGPFMVKCLYPEQANVFATSGALYWPLDAY